MSKSKRKIEEIVFGQEQNIEDVERVSNILNRRMKKSNVKLGAPSDKKKNPFLKPDGGFDLIEKFPGYEDKKKRKKEGDKL